jgi:hypothetical protein
MKKVSASSKLFLRILNMAFFAFLAKKVEMLLFYSFEKTTLQKI